jgi:hypothetical protein
VKHFFFFIFLSFFFKIFFFLKINRIDYTEKFPENNYKTLVGYKTRNVIFSDYMLYLKKGKWARFWIALVSQSDLNSQEDEKLKSRSLKRKKSIQHFANSHMRLIIAPNKFVDEQISLNLEIGEWKVEKIDCEDKEFTFKLSDTFTFEEYVFSCYSLHQFEEWKIELEHFTQMAHYKSQSSIKN